ncbi:transcriptional regulator [Skermania piniformis]|nr:transcriptional regulator [Skermania piniformis]
MALRPDDDVARVARRVESAHQSFVERADGADVRGVVFDSWLRSRDSGVDPNRVVPAVPVNSSELRRYRAAHPMALIRPVIERLLVADAADTGLIVASTDECGRLLWVEGDTAARDRAAAMNFAEGADWSERSAGTNAPGTALAVDHAVQIFGAEHFVRPAHHWSCTAAPVHDPHSGAIIGAIDLTGGPRVAAPEVLALVRATVAAAEAELRWQLPPRPPEPAQAAVDVLGVVRPVLVRNGSELPLWRRHAEILVLLGEYPQGLSGDRLGVLLDEADLDTVTVRAAMSRLRKVSGDGLIGSRPYRLVAPLDTDVGRVRAALDRGDVHGALDAYAGPVLPTSMAPGVLDLREQLHARVRAAVLGAADQRALARWTAGPQGRDDMVAWVAYLSALDPDSPMYAQVRAQVELIDRRLG